MKKIYLLGALLVTAISTHAQIVISQFYGAGGNSGATYNIDYVELFNNTANPVSINGWSIQYNSATGTSAWLYNSLPNATIQPYSYYLVTFGNAGTNGSALPVTADFNYTGTTPAPLNLSGSNGRLALVSVATAKPAGCITADLIDMVGYGTGNCFETQATAALSSTTAAIRLNGGCRDTNNNSTDFSVTTPNPRNSSSSTNNCTLSVSENNIPGLSIYPNPTKQSLYITSASFVEKDVVLYDVLGKVALSSKVANQPINVTSLPKGVYVAKITEEGKTATRKVVIE